MYLAVNQEAEEHTHQAENDGAEKCRPESRDVESRNEERGQLQHQGVDDQPKETQGEYSQGQGNDLEKQAHCCIDQADDDRGDESGAQSSYFDAG